MADAIDQDARLKKSADAGRASRASEDVRRQDADGTGTTVSERRKMLRNEWTQEALPTPPEIPGYHLCWLSSNNSYDPIHKRVRMGYEPVRIEDVPGFEAYRTNSGDWEGYITCNEMLLFKIPNELYNELMQEMHYHMPLEEEDKLKAAAILGRDSNGKQLGSIEGDGIASLGGPARTPTFY